MKIGTQREKLIATVNDSSNIITLQSGVVVVNTGKYTGRSPNAKAIVSDSTTREAVDWSNNSECSLDDWAELFVRARDFEYNNGEVIEQTLYAGRDEKHQLKLTVKTTHAWQALFANNMFVRSRQSDIAPSQSWELMCFPELESQR